MSQRVAARHLLGSTSRLNLVSLPCNGSCTVYIEEKAS